MMMMMMNAPEHILDLPVEVLACKFDGSVHRRWPATLIRHEDSMLVLRGVFEHEIRHPLLGTIAPGTVSTEYYWTTHWLSVFRFETPSGCLRNYYCNVNLPPELIGDQLTFIDLDIDVLVHPDLSYTILDEDEFASNALRYNYPPEIRAGARLALGEIIRRIEGRAFPFLEGATLL